MFFASLYCAIMFSCLRATIRQMNEQHYQTRLVSKAKSTFLSTIGHEIRTPLNAIIGCADLLLIDKSTSTPLTAKQRENVETILSCGTILLETMNSVLKYTKLETALTDERTKSQVITLGEFNFKNLITESLQMFRNTAAEKNIDLTLEYGNNNSNTEQETTSVIEQIYSDAGALRTVMNNLISNACKFTPSGGAVQVKVSTTNGECPTAVKYSNEMATSNSNYSTATSSNNTTPGNNSNTPSTPSNSNLQFSKKCLIVQVLDTGIGIDPLFKNNMFKPFSQQDSHIHRQYGGTGLGLAISKSIIELLGGTITYSNRGLETRTVNSNSSSGTNSGNGQGACFTIKLPIIQLNNNANSSSSSNATTTLSNNNNTAAATTATTTGSGNSSNNSSPSTPTLNSTGSVTMMQRTASLSNLSTLSSSSSSSWSKKQKSKQLRQEQFKPRVLVVDDNLINIKVFDKMLTDLQVEHTCVTSGASALEEFAAAAACCPTGVSESSSQAGEALGEKQAQASKTRPFDIILLDIEMPVMSGLVCASELRKRHGNEIPFHIYFVTGYDRSNIDEEFMQLVDGFMQKPIRVQNIQDILNQFIEMKEHQAEEEKEKDEGENCDEDEEDADNSSQLQHNDNYSI